jgi:hypothetical protein
VINGECCIKQSHISNPIPAHQAIQYRYHRRAKAYSTKYQKKTKQNKTKQNKTKQNKKT